MKAVAILVLGLLAGCGYHLQGRAEVPEAARTVSIRLFSNHTPEQGLEVRLRRAIDDEFRRRGSLHVVDDPEGDLILSGEIHSFRSVPVAYSATDETALIEQFLARKFRGRDLGALLQEEKHLASAFRRLRTAGFSAGSSIQVLKRYAAEAGRLEEIAEDEPAE